MEHFAFPDNIDFAADDQRIHVLFMKGSCNCSSMKQSYTIGESQAISHLDDTEQQAQQVAEILHFQPRLLWRTPTKIHHERRRRRPQEAARKAQRTSLSTAKATSSTQWPQMYRSSDKILQLHCKRNRWREGTPTVDASKSEGKIRQRLKFTVKIVFFDAAIGSNSYTICTVHVKNIFPTD